MSFQHRNLSQLTIRDAKAFRGIPLYITLRDLLIKDNFQFRIADAGQGWQRVLFLNLTYWNAAESNDILEDESIDADVVAHVAWHYVARRALPTQGKSDALFLGESIASAFDLYLVGRILGRVRNSSFLQTQLPAMAAVAEQAGMAPDDFQILMESVAADPARAFEDLRQLLFDASTGLVGCDTMEAADQLLKDLSEHRFGALLHHYELSTWVLFARAYSSCQPAPEIRALDATLRAAPVSLEWLSTHWL
jgi:hypothetical protein